MANQSGVPGFETQDKEKRSGCFFLNNSGDNILYSTITLNHVYHAFHIEWHRFVLLLRIIHERSAITFALTSCDVLVTEYNERKTTVSPGPAETVCGNLILPIPEKGRHQHTHILKSAILFPDFRSFLSHLAVSSKFFSGMRTYPSRTFISVIHLFFNLSKVIRKIDVSKSLCHACTA